MKIEDGHAMPSNEAGLGIAWDREKLARARLWDPIVIR
jgi:hypothetical protein